MYEKLTCLINAAKKIDLETGTLVSIDKIIENKNSPRMCRIFCFTLSQLFVQKDQNLVKKAIKFELSF